MIQQQSFNSSEGEIDNKHEEWLMYNCYEVIRDVDKTQNRIREMGIAGGSCNLNRVIRAWVSGKVSFEERLKMKA